MGRRPKQLCILDVFRYPWPLTFVSFIVLHLSVRNYGRRGGNSIDIISFLRCQFSDSFERSNTLLSWGIFFGFMIIPWRQLLLSFRKIPSVVRAKALARWKWHQKMEIVAAVARQKELHAVINAHAIQRSRVKTRRVCYDLFKLLYSVTCVQFVRSENDMWRQVQE